MLTFQGCINSLSYSNKRNDTCQNILEFFPFCFINLFSIPEINIKSQCVNTYKQVQIEVTIKECVKSCSCCNEVIKSAANSDLKIRTFCCKAKMCSQECYKTNEQNMVPYLFCLYFTFISFFWDTIKYLK